MCVSKEKVRADVHANPVVMGAWFRAIKKRTMSLVLILQEREISNFCRT